MPCHPRLRNPGCDEGRSTLEYRGSLRAPPESARGARASADDRDTECRGLTPGRPVLSGREFVQVFDNLDWQVARAHGRRIILVKPDHPATVSAPEHRTVAKGTLRRPIRAAGLTVEAFEAKTH